MAAILKMAASDHIVFDSASVVPVDKLPSNCEIKKKKKKTAGDSNVMKKSLQRNH